MNIRKLAQRREMRRQHFSQIKRIRPFERGFAINLPNPNKKWVITKFAKALDSNKAAVILEDADTVQSKRKPVTVIDPDNKFGDMNLVSLLT